MEKFRKSETCFTPEKRTQIKLQFTGREDPSIPCKEPECLIRIHCDGKWDQPGQVSVWDHVTHSFLHTLKK
jgi:hypothetical protein